MTHAPLSDADLSILRLPREDPPPPNRTRRWIGWLTGALAVGLCLVVLYQYLPFSEEWTPEVETAAVRPIESGPTGSPFVASGYVVAQRQASVASKGTGRLEYLGIAVGSRVKAGDIIARIQQDDVVATQRQARARLEVAKATLENAQAELQDARLAYDRANALLPDQFISQSEFDTAANRLRKAEASVRSASAAITAAEADVLTADVMLENTKIRAPFDGIVLKKFAEVGEIVAPMAGSTNARGAVALIGDPNTLVVEVDISESTISRIAPGQSADITLDALPGVRYRGIVEQIVPTADRSKGTVLVKVRFLDLDDRVLPEMSAKVSFTPPNRAESAEPKRFLVPAVSLVNRNHRTVVYVLDHDTAREIPVEEISRHGADSEVRGDLSSTARVVLAPSPSMRPGSRVRPRIVQ
ncbi:MAG: efflux RND transporter periplasmic adaptor subunit [Nitrospira sp.]|nr:efflux RND transporter periplasmic adaptor subunit [Nitrospira sp.]